MQGKEKEFVWLDTIDGLDSWSLLDTGHVNTPMQIAVPPMADVLTPPTSPGPGDRSDGRLTRAVTQILGESERLCV